MGRYRNYFFGGLLIIVGVIFLNGCSQAWKNYQKQYNKLLEQKNIKAGKPIEIKEKSISYDLLQVNDRCISCHAGVANPSMANAPQPFKTHPGGLLKKHDWQKIGCTICHQGNGATVIKSSAHKNMLKAEMVQTTCYQCHPRSQRLPGARQLNHGQKLFTDLQCTGCHFVKDLSPARHGPALNGIGSRINRKWLRYWLKNPSEMMANAKMPNFYLNDDYADAVAAYLMTFKDEQLENDPEPPEGDPEEGKNILRHARCISCHAFNGRGGLLGPDLGRLGNKTNRKFLFAKIKAPNRFEPASTMPKFNFSDQQIADVVDYLIDEYTDYDLMDIFDTDSLEAKNDSTTLEQGRKIYKELRCANCHLLKNDIKWMRLGPRLTLIGDKPLEAFNFGNSSIPRTRASYIFEKIKNPKAYTTVDHPQKMPLFNLDNSDIYNLTLLLLSFNNKKIASPLFMAFPDTALYQPQGEYGRLVEKFQCFSCHRINGRGFNLAYDLSIEGNRVSREWLYNYLMIPYSLRPILVERMPNFNFTPREANIITDYIMSNYTSSWIPRHPEKRFSPQLARQGKRLVAGKGCLACHILDDKGGYVGPSFTTGTLAGDKLQAEWIYQWLKNPQKIVPGVLEPNYDLSNEEALAITAYLMSINNEDRR